MALNRREALILGGAGLASAVAGGIVGAFLVQAKSGAAALLAQPYRDLAGVERRLSEWRGRVLVCNFWATWCAPCREEVPLLIAAQQKYGPKGVQIVGIGIDQASKIVEFSKEFKITYSLLVADGASVDTMKNLGNRQGALPFTAILEPQGALAESRLGAFQVGELDRVLDRLLG